MPRMTERWLPDTSVLLARARKEPVKDMGLEGNKCCPYTITLRYGVEIYEDDMDTLPEFIEEAIELLEVKS